LTARRACANLSRRFVKRGLIVVHDRAAARDDRGPNGIQTSVSKPPGVKPRGPGESDERGVHRPVDGVADFGAFPADGHRVCRLPAGSAVVPTAGSVLGAGNNGRDHAVIAGSCARGAGVPALWGSAAPDRHAARSRRDPEAPRTSGNGPFRAEPWPPPSLAASRPDLIFEGRPPSCLRREASFLVIRPAHLLIDSGGLRA
jgi:hypothetical protein